MAKEIYLYSGIYNFIAEELIKAIEENMNVEVVLRENTPGGDVFATWGIIAKIQEHGNVTVKVDGAAFSGGANILLYANRVESLDVSTFMFHRADMYVETPEQQIFLDKVNKDLKAKMLQKIDSEKLKALKGVTIEELFNPETRINLFLTAKEMKTLGLVHKINKVEPSEVTAFQEFFKIAAEHNPTQNQKITMTSLAELKEKFPALYALAVEEGKKAGIAAEKDRVGAAMVFAHLDPEGVKKIIQSGEAMTATQMAEFSLKAASPTALAAIKDASQKDVVTDEKGAILTAEQKKVLEVKTFEEGVRAAAGLDKMENANKRVVLASA